MKILVDFVKYVVNHPCFAVLTKLIGYIIKIVTIISAITAKVAAHSSSMGATVSLEVARLVVKIVNTFCNHIWFINDFVKTFAKAMDHIKSEDSQKKLLGFQYFGELLGISVKEIAEIVIEVVSF